MTLLFANVFPANVYAGPQLATPTSGVTTFNSFPATYTEYARTTNGASGFTAANLAGWDISLFTTAGSDAFIISSDKWEAASSDGAFLYLGLDSSGTQTITSVRFASNDGKLFDFNAIDLAYDSSTNAPAISFTFTGYLDGSPVSGATLTTSTYAALGNSGAWQRAISFTGNPNFQGIDEVRITPSSAVLALLYLDNINATDFRDAATAPTLTATGGTPTFTQGSSTGVDLFSSVSAATNDSSQTFASAVFTVSHVADTTEYLTIGGADIALTNGASGTISGVGTYSVIVASGTATVTLSGMTQAEADMDTLIDGITYKNSDASVTTGSRVVTLVSVTDSGSSNNSATVNLTATVMVEAPASTLIWRTASNSTTGILGYDAATDRSGKIVDANPHPYDSFLSPLARVGDAIYTIVVGPENTYQLVRYDGVNLTVLSDLPFANINDVTAYGDDVVFWGTLDSSVYNLYLYDTAAGTVSLLGGPTPAIVGTQYSSITALDDDLYVSGSPTWNTNYLYRWDGTTFTELKTGSNESFYVGTFAPNVIVLNNTLYLVGQPTSGDRTEWWRLDGATLSKVTNAAGLSTTNVEDGIIYNNRLYYAFNPTNGAGDGLNIYSIGTSASETPVTEWNPVDARHLYVVDGQLYMIGTTDNDGGGWDIYRYNSAASVTRVTTLDANYEVRPLYLRLYAGDLYFIAGAGAETTRDLYRYDWDTQSTTKVVDSDNFGVTFAGDASLVVFDQPLGASITGLYDLQGVVAGTPLSVALALEVVNITSPSLIGAKVTITSGLQAGDSLTFTAAAGITGAYNSLTGVLTLTGTATVTDYQTLLRSVIFTAADVAGDRAILFQVTDEAGTLSTATNVNALAAIGVTTSNGTRTQLNFDTAPTGLSAGSFTGSFSMPANGLGKIDFLTTNDPLTVTLANLTPAAGVDYGMTYDASSQRLSIWPSIDYTNGVVLHGTDYLVISSGNGREFDFQGLRFDEPNYTVFAYTFTGFRDGTQIDQYTFSFINGMTNTLILPTTFSNIDEVRISNANGFYPTLMGLFDDLLILEPAALAANVPSLTATGATTTFTQGSATGVDLFSSVVAATNDSGQTFASAVFTVSNVADITEYLVISGTAVALTDGVSGTISGVGSYTVTVASGTATVTLSGLTLSDANLGTLIDGITYKNSANPATSGSRVVTLVSVTDSGGSNNRATISLVATVTVQVPEPAIYYLSADANGSALGVTDALNRIKPDGTGAAVIKSSIHPQPGDLALDLANQRAFFLGGTSTVPGLFGLDLTTNTVFTITTLAQQPAYGGLAYDPVYDDLYYLSSDGNGTGLGAADALHRIKPDGTGDTVLKSSINAGPGDLALDLANQRVFFLGATSPKPGVYSFDLTTNTVFTITTLSQAVAYGGLAYDAVHDFLYYFSTNGNGSTLGTEDALHRIKPDGTGDAVIKSSIHPGPGDLTLDIPNQRAFYLGAVPTNPGVFGINLATSNVFTITTLPNNPAHGGIVYNDDSIPTFDGSNSAPADEATSVAPSANLALRFSEPVIKGITGTFTLRDVTTNSVLETLAYTDTQIAGWATNTLTITPSANLPAGHVIAVQWRFGAIRDYYDNYVVANATDTTYNFTVGAASNVTLSVTKAGNGTGTVTSLPAGITCGLTCTTSVNSGTVVTLTAAADVGSVFAGWTGACSGTGACTVTMSANEAVTATFQIIESTQPYTSITGKAGTLHAVGGYLSPITVKAAPSGLPRGIKLPLGQLSFTITGTVPGGTIQLSLYADSSLNVSSYYKRNRTTNAWTNIATTVGVANGTTTRVDFSLTDGGPYDADGIANGIIVDPGGVGANFLAPLVRENTLFVATVEPLTDTVTVGAPTYAIAGGADAALFTIDAATGLLQFISAPDYENPGTANTDSAGRPVYAVEVTITGATAGVDTLTLAVSLLDDTATDGVILNLAGDYTLFTLNTPEYIDVDPTLATVGANATDSFANGTLTITQMSGPVDGSFSFDLNGVTAGGDGEIAGGEAVATNNSSFSPIGAIDNQADGQNGHALVIHFNGSATADNVAEIINSLLYTAPTGGVREFYVYVNDGDGNTYGTSESVSFVMAGPTAQLQVSMGGVGRGAVTSSGGEISCSRNCTQAIGNGLVVTLTATADSGSTFTGWSGACTGTGSCAVTMTAANAVTATFGSACPTGVVYVDKNASGANTGLSWADAHTDLAQTLQQYRTCGGILDEIWVARGVYTPGLTVSDTFTIPAGVALYGGFAATETVRTERDWVANLTVLSGDIGGDDTTDATGVITDPAHIVGANAYQVALMVSISDTAPITEATRLDGFTITGGSATGLGYNRYGGGLFCHAYAPGSVCSPTLAHVTFSGNTASIGGGMAAFAEGGTSSPVLTDVRFQHNSAVIKSFGGAFASLGIKGENSPQLTNVTFYSNTGAFGGALLTVAYSDTISSPTLTNVTFENNAAAIGGAMFNSSYESSVLQPTLTNTHFRNNRSFIDSDFRAALDRTDIGNEITDGFGGALVNLGFLGTSRLLLTDSTFENNSAGAGGALTTVALGSVADATLLNTEISSNQAITGGGLYAMSLAGSVNLTFTNVLLHDNAAEVQGGALATKSLYGSTHLTLTNTTVSSNTAGTGGAINMLGTGDYAQSNTLQLANSILWGNRAITSSDQISVSEAVTVAIADSLIEGGWNGPGIVTNKATVVDEGGNVDGDPLFADMPAADLRLLTGSPAIDQGDNSALPVGLLTDLLGNLRIVNQVVDMGAYEAQGYTLTIRSGGVQTTAVNLPFSTPLQLAVTDSANAPVGAGAVVTLVPPTSGAGLSSSLPFTAVTGADGTATVTVTANSLVGSYVVTATATGVITPVVFSLHNQNAITTTLTLTTMPSPVAAGDPLTLTATLSPTAAGGAVQFYVDGAPFGVTQPLTAGAAQLVTTTLPVGTYVISATYGGNGAYLPSTAEPVTQTVSIVVNQVPVLTNLDGGNTFTEDGSAVVIDSDVTVSDAELDARNGGNGNYAGATLTIARNGGANAQDQFGHSGQLGALMEGQSLTYNSVTVGTVITNSNGTLSLAFTSTATTALVNGLLQSLTYSNTADLPPAKVILDWAFRDGQGGTAIAPDAIFFTSAGSANPFAALTLPFGSTPTFVDIDNDGDWDLFSGSGDGPLAFYRNTGTATLPAFTAVTGSDDPFDGITFSYNSRPAFADIDGDGDPDAVIGDGGGAFLYYQNTGTASSPVFTAVTGSSNPFDGLSVGANSAPALVDIDGDGDWDLFSGENNGGMLFYRNTGTANAPAFTAVTGSSNPFNGVDVGILSRPAFADVDGDGDPDALIGDLMSGGVKFYRNAGTATAPSFTEVTGSANPFDGLSAGSNSAPAFADLDGDGDPDAFSGSYGGTIFAYHNTTSRLPNARVLISATNDDPRLSGLPLGITVTQNVTSTVDLSSLTFSDPDAAQNTVTLIISATAGTLAASDSGGVTVGGSGSAILYLSGPAASIDTYLNTGSNITYLTALNATGVTTFTLLANDGGNSGNGGGVDVTLGLVTVTIPVPINAAPTLNNLTGSTFIENDNGVVIDSNVTVADTELDARNGGNGNYDGATLIISRHGGANGQDTFAHSGQLGVLTGGQPLTHNSFTVGTVITNSGGILGLTFNNTATTTLVNDVLQSITYATPSDAPPASVTLDWIFRDGAGGIATLPVTLTFAAITGTGNPFHGLFVESINAPTFVDIDNDGDQDAFIGGDSGKLLFYRNTGTASSPAFTAITDSNNPFDGVTVGRYSAPTFVDIDNDGDQDAFIGELAGVIFFYRNTGTASIPVFTAMTGSDNPLNGVDVGDVSTPTFVDIDNDGDQDAFIGNDSGILRFYRNIGSASTPLFSAVTGAGDPFGGADIADYIYADFVDIDSDGDYDAFISDYDGAIFFYRNMGDAKTPIFTAMLGSDNPFNGVPVGYASALTFVDIDSDGDQDVFVGAYDSLLSFYRNTTSSPIPHAVITITAVNDDPTATGLPLSMTITQNVTSDLDLTALTFSDLDALTDTVTFKISAAAGLLAATSGSGVTVSGSSTSQLTLVGTVAAIDSYLNTADNIHYISALNAIGDTTITLTANDGGHHGTGGGTDVTLGVVTVTVTASATPTPTVTPTGTATNTPTSTPTGMATSTSTATPTPTGTLVATNTPTATPTGTLPTPTATPTPTQTGTATVTPTGTIPTATATATATGTPVSTSTATVTPTGTLPTSTATGTVTPTNTPTATGTLAPTNTPTVTPTGTLPTATATPTPASTNTPTATGTLAPTNTPTVTPTGTLPTATATPTATQTGTATVTPTGTVPTATAPATATGTPAPTNTSTVTPTGTLPTPTATPTATQTGTATVTPTGTIPTATATATATGTPAPTSTATGAPTTPVTPTSTATPTATGTLAPTNTPTVTPTGTLPTATSTTEPTSTATVTPTATATNTATLTPTATVTPTGTLMPTATPTGTDLPTSTVTPTATDTVMPTATATNTAEATSTATPLVTPTATATNMATSTEEPTSTPTVTATNTAESTSTATPSVTPTGTSTATMTPTATSTAEPTSTPTATATNTATPTATNTTVPSPTATATATSTTTPAPTLTPTASATATATQTPAPGTISGTLFVDRNGNRTQDNGEPGLAGATVTLATTGGQVATMNTDSSGYYQFRNLTPGVYEVQAVASGTWVAQSATTKSVNLGSGSATIVNFRYQSQGAITGVVFHDLDGSGNQGPGESGVSGATVQLLQNGTLVTSTLSSDDGSYQFSGIVPGSYIVALVPLTDFVVGTGAQQPVILAADGASSVNFGLQAVSTIAGVVYIDRNGDGSHQDSEPGIGAATVSLFTAGPDGVFRTGDELLVSSTSSAADGSYRFVNQAVGAYAVQLTVPAGYTVTSPSEVVVNLAQFWTAVANFGNQALNTIVATTFEDRNNNGIQDDDEEPLAGLPVFLEPATQSAEARVTISATTNSAGLVTFQDVPAGDYLLRTTTPASGYVGQRTLAALTLPPNGVGAAQFGFQQIGTVSGVIFTDGDGNGRRDPGEGGLSGVTVTLSPRNQSAVAGALATTVTAGDGSYHFGALAAGAYQLAVTPPTGYVATAANPVDLTLSATGANAALAVSMGFVANGNVSGRVFADLNKNGVQEMRELGVSGATITLQGNGQAERTVQTTVDGLFLLSGVANGVYQATLTLPPNHTATTALVTTITVDASQAATARFGVRPNLPNQAPQLATLANVAFLRGQTVTIQATATDVDDVVLVFSATGLPPGLAIDSATGLISGELAADATGTYLITITVTDPQGASSQRSFTVEVLSPTGEQPVPEPGFANRLYLPLVTR